PDGGRHSGKKVCRRKRSEEPDLYQADLLPGIDERIDGLLSRLATRPHQDNHAIGIGGTRVVEKVVVPTGHTPKLVHGLLNDGRNSGVVGIGALSRLKENIRILGCSANDRVVGRQRTLPMGIDESVVNHLSYLVLGWLLYLHYLMRGSKPVKYVQKWHSRSKGRGLGNKGKVHDLLDRCGKEHRPARGP